MQLFRIAILLFTLPVVTLAADDEYAKCIKKGDALCVKLGDEGRLNCVEKHMSACKCVKPEPGNWDWGPGTWCTSEDQNTLRTMGFQRFGATKHRSGAASATGVSLGVSTAQVIVGLPPFSLQEAPLADGRERRIGQTSDGTATLELTGPTNDLTQAYLLVIGPATQRASALLSRFIQNTLPGWSGRDAWVRSALKHIAQSPARTTVGASVVEIERDGALGALIATIRTAPSTATVSEPSAPDASTGKETRHPKQKPRSSTTARTDLLGLGSPGLSQEQREYLERETAENGLRIQRAKRTGQFTYGVGPKGVGVGGGTVAFHDKRDFVIFFWDPQLKLDRKRDCLVSKSHGKSGASCIPESRGRTVAYDEIWEDVPPSGAWGRSYWKDGRFAVAVAFEDDDLSMVFERDWCVAAVRCAAEP